MNAVAVTESVTGLVAPGAADDEIEQLDVAAAWAGRDVLATLAPDPDSTHPTLRSAADRLATAAPDDVLHLLRRPAAQAALFRASASLPNIDDPPYRAGSSEAWRWVSEVWADGCVPDAGDVAVVRGGNGLYLDGYGAVLRADGPVALYRNATGLRVVAAAGGSVELVGDTASLAPGLCGGGLVEILPRAGGRPLLNAWPVAARWSRVVPADRSETARSVPVLEAGLALLDDVWPAMRSTVDRWVKAFVVIAYDGCARSHTSIYAPHVLMCSGESALSVAEALCHEVAHGRLFTLAAAHRLIVDDNVPRHDSPWRPDRRPLISFLNGAHAFLAVCEFFRRLAGTDPLYASIAEQAVARQAPRVRQAWSYLLDNASWTPAGERVVATLTPAVEALPG